MDSTRRLLITGLARNVEQVLTKEIDRLRRVTEEFYAKVNFHIVESDSSDSTLQKLEELASRNFKLTFESLGTLEQQIPNRIDRLRYCRNRYISFFRNSNDEYSEIMVVDFDIKNYKFNHKSMRRVFYESVEWDALFANQTGRYFDIFALREVEWCRKDCMQEVEELVKAGIDRELAKEQAIWNKMKKISTRIKPIEVDSAFGGMAIYKSWVFRQFDYSTLSTTVLPRESEHVALHYKIRKAEGRMFIHPGLNNFGWNPHNLASFRALRRLDQMTESNYLRGIRRRIRSLLG